MKRQEKIDNLKDEHLSEWLKEWQRQRDELSENQSIFCVCGRLATGLHQNNCRKFHKEVDKRTFYALEHLLTLDE